MGIAEGFSMGMSAGRSIRQGIDRQQALEYQRQRDAAVDAHRKFSEGLQQQQLDLQKRNADNVLLQQMHGLLTNPQLHPQAKQFIADDIARQRGIDPKSEYFQSFKKMLLTLPADQARALSNGLVKVFPDLPPGKVGEIVDGLFTGGISATQIPGLLKDLQSHSAAMDAQKADQGMFEQLDAGGAPPDVEGAVRPAAPVTTGALPADPGAPAGATDAFGAPGGAGGADSGAVDPGIDQNTALGGFMPAPGGASGADFSAPTMQGGGSQGGALNDLAANGGASFTAPSSAQPGMSNQLDQMRAGMDQRGGLPPGGPLLKDLLLPSGKFTPPNAAAKSGSLNAPAQAAPAPASAQVPEYVDPTAPAPAPAPMQPAAGAIGPSDMDPDYWFKAATMVEKRGGPGAIEKAKSYREHAESLDKSAKATRDDQKAFGEAEKGDRDTASGARFFLDTMVGAQGDLQNAKQLIKANPEAVGAGSTTVILQSYLDAQKTGGNMLSTTFDLVARTAIPQETWNIAAATEAAKSKLGAMNYGEIRKLFTVGQVTEGEWRIFQNLTTSFNLTQDAKTLTRNLEYAERLIEKYKANVHKSYEAQFGRKLDWEPTETNVAPPDEVVGAPLKPGSQRPLGTPFPGKYRTR